MMGSHRREEVRARTPSSAVLVQMLFVLGAVGTGVVSALVTWLGPRERSAPPPSSPDGPPRAAPEEPPDVP